MVSSNSKWRTEAKAALGFGTDVDKLLKLTLVMLFHSLGHIRGFFFRFGHTDKQAASGFLGLIHGPILVGLAQVSLRYFYA